MAMTPTISSGKIIVPFQGKESPSRVSTIFRVPKRYLNEVGGIALLSTTYAREYNNGFC
jgi:hypothetical protein